MVRPRLSRDLKEVIEEAEALAREAEQDPSSLHLLLGFLTAKNRAERFLRDRGLTEDRLLLGGPAPEPRGAVRSIMERAVLVATGCGLSEVHGLHVLVGMTRVPESAAYGALERAGERIPRLRTHALTLLMGGSPRWLDRETPARALDPGMDPDRALPPPRSGTSGTIENRARAVEWTPPLLGPPPLARRDPPPRRAERRAPETSEPAAPEPGAPTLPNTPAEPEPSPPKPKRGARSGRPGLKPSPSGPRELRVPDDPGAAWLLPEGDFPWLTSLGRNLSAEAARGRLDPLIGREAELMQVSDVLGKRRANNACLVGPPGVGKTAIVEGLASRWVEGSAAERARVLIALDVGSLLVGTQLRGSFQEKLRGLIDEVRRAEGKVILFFDELHTLVGAGAAGDGPLDAAEALKAALARGELPCVGATTTAEYRAHIESDPALSRRFVPVRVEEPSPRDCEATLYQVLPGYAAHHGVGYTPAAVEAAVRLSIRYLPEQHLPDKAIALLDLAGSRAARSGLSEVTPEGIAALLAERLGLPVERLLDSDHARLLRLEQELSARVVGQDRALGRVAEAVRRQAAGFGGSRPRGVFLFVGPSGVGKTETAKVLAELLYGESGLVRVDLSEFSEAHSVARLVGAPPGYVGHDAGGQLTEAVRRKPACVLLLDEIEKAHREVLQVFLQVFDEGRLTDTHGRTVSFTETIIVLTSNLGAGPERRRIGFQGDEAAADLLEAARVGLAPELWGRIDEKLTFSPLSLGELSEVARRLARASSERLERQRGVGYTLDEAALELVVEQGGRDAALGARPLHRVLAHLVEGPIAARLLEGRLFAGEHVRVGRHPAGGLSFRVLESGPTLSQRPASVAGPPPAV